MRSDEVKNGLDRAGHRSLLMATGVTKEQFKAPFIGIASSFSDLVPGHAGMRDLERQIEKGIHTGGGQAFIFGVPAVCDGIAMGHCGMSYSLPSRDLIADCVDCSKCSSVRWACFTLKLRQNYSRYDYGCTKIKYPMCAGYSRSNARWILSEQQTYYDKGYF